MCFGNEVFVSRVILRLRQHDLRSAAAFWGFSRGGFQKMPAFEGQFLKEIPVRFAGANHLRTQKKKNTHTHKTKLCAEVPERPLPKDPFLQLLIREIFEASTTALARRQCWQILRSFSSSWQQSRVACMAPAQQTP